MGNGQGSGLRKRHAKHNGGEIVVKFLDEETPQDSLDEVPFEFRKRLEGFSVDNPDYRPSFIKLSFIDYAGSAIVQEFYEVIR